MRRRRKPLLLPSPTPDGMVWVTGTLEDQQSGKKFNATVLCPIRLVELKARRAMQQPFTLAEAHEFQDLLTSFSKTLTEAVRKRVDERVGK